MLSTGGDCRIVEIFFNELCINDIELFQYNDLEGFKELSKVFARVGIKICRIFDKHRLQLISNARIICHKDKNLIDYMYGFFQAPYESKDVEENQDLYLEHKWQYQGRDCYGVVLAYIMESFSLSIGNKNWNLNFLNIQRDEDTVSVRNLYNADSWECHYKWFESTLPIILVKCNIPPNEKKIKLRDDHGKNVLGEFCKRLVNSEYVCEVVNSLEFHRNNRRFINRVYSNGMVDFVLSWTDEGYGVAVQTTGRNERETKRIAEILKEKYGHI